MGFISLVRNENMKLYRRMSTWALIGLLFFLITGMAFTASKSEPTGNNWKQKLTTENQQMASELAQSKGSDQGKQRTESMMAINQYRIDHNLKPSLGNRFVQDSQDMMQLIELLTICIAAGIVASEFNWGTIKLLTIRPYQRWKILLSKYLAVFLFTLFLLTISLLTIILLAMIIFGTEGLFQQVVLYQNGTIITKSTASFLAQNFALNMVDLVMLSTFAFLISTVFRSQSLATGIGITTLFIGKTLSLYLASKFTWAKYNFLLHTDWTPYFHGSPTLPGMSLQLSVSICAISFIVMNFITFFVFQKRDLTN